MASNTPRGIQYPTSADKVKDGGTPSALADDFRDLAVTTDTAIADAVREAVNESNLNYGALSTRVLGAEQKNIQQDQAIIDAKQDAIADASTKYGGLPARLTAVEQKNVQQDVNIGEAAFDKGVLDQDLNTVQSSGRWSVNTKTLPNMPVPVEGELYVSWGNNTGVQEYTVRQTPVSVYYRRYAAGNWGAWHLGALSARMDAMENPRSLDAGESLDTVLAQGNYMQVFTDRPSLALGYPVEKTGYLRVRRWNIAGTHVVQEYFPLDDSATYSRIIYSSTPIPWLKHEDAAVTRAYVDDAIAGLGNSLPGENVPATIPRQILFHTEAGHGVYVPSGSAGTWDLNDSTDFAVGSQSIRFSTDGAGTAASMRLDLPKPLDLRDADLQIWFKTDNWSTDGGISLYLGTGGFSNYYQWGLDSPNEKVYLQPGSWHLLTIPFTGYNRKAGNPDRGNLTHLQIRAVDNKTGSFTYKIGPMYALPKSRKFPHGVVSFSFDDTLENNYIYARPIMDKYGLSGTAYVNTESVGTSGRMSMEQLHALQDRSGWEIAGHSFTSAGHNDRFTSLSEAELEIELGGLAQWLKDNRFNGTSVAYPGGSFNDLVKRITLRHFKAGRAIAPFFETLPPGDPAALSTAVYVLSGTTTVEDVKANIDDEWDQKYWAHLCFHGIVPEPGMTTQYSTVDFEAICAYIAEKGIPMRKVQQVLSDVL